MHSQQVECPTGWSPMELNVSQAGAASKNTPHEPSSVVVLPSCYFLSDKELHWSWSNLFRECIELGGTLFYATNDLDEAWLTDRLERLPDNTHVPLNIHQKLYASNWSWAPPPPPFGALLFYLNHTSAWFTATTTSIIHIQYQCRRLWDNPYTSIDPQPLSGAYPFITHAKCLSQT